MNEYKPDILQVRDPVTGEFVPIAAIKGDKGDVGPEGKQGPKGDPGEVTQADFDREIASLSEQIVDKVTIPAIGTVGQVMAVKSVDAQGKPNEFECVDQSGGSGGVGKKTPEGGEIFNAATGAGENSHAEGLRTLAYGAQSHAEGFAPPEKVTGTLNVTASEIVGTGYRQNTHIIVSVPYSDVIDDGYNIIGIQLTGGILGSHSVFTDDTNVLNIFDMIQLSLNEDSQSILIKIAEPVTIATGNYAITLIEQGAIGVSSHAEGGKTIAAGQASHAEGFGSKVLYKVASADATGAHAEGTNTIAMGKGAHSEGGDTYAEGKYSHSEGDSTTASGAYSHSEGRKTTASSKNSHAEGWETTASGESSHAEGGHHFGDLGSVASGSSSHAEGNSTTASGEASHSEGLTTTASGDWSHAEGRHTTASSFNSHAEGSETTASGKYSHAEGSGTTASGSSSHAEGNDTTASGDHGSHAEGNDTTASGDYGSHAEGDSTTASGECQHVQGKYNIPDTNDGTPEGTPNNKYAHIVGNGNDDGPETIYSNAHTLDWEGNAWYAGTVEGTAMIVKSSTPGSAKRFRITVDDSGTIKAEEVV